MRNPSIGLRVLYFAGLESKTILRGMRKILLVRKTMNIIILSKVRGGKIMSIKTFINQSAGEVRGD
jgi:hypothetical protein